MMYLFIKNNLSNYTRLNNDPNANALSDLSPYIHFGHISAQRVADLVLSKRELAEAATGSVAELGAPRT